MTALLAANDHADWLAPSAPLPWITQARFALGRREARDLSWLMDWLKRDGRRLGDPSETPWCSDFVETCKVGQQPRMRRPLPSPRMITESDEAMLWLRWVEPDIARILWARANRLPWKGICYEHAISRATANRRHDYGLAVIVWRLNGKSAPTKRSREFVVAHVSK